MANLMLPSSAASSTGDIDVRFVNHERGQPDKSLPKGVPHKETQECAFRIMLSPGDGVEIRTFSKAITEASMCIKQKAIPVPRCSAKQVWAKAIAKGAPSDAVASLSYRPELGGRVVWWFDIDGGFDARFADDC